MRDRLTSAPTADLLKLGEEYARERNMQTLRPDERLPFGYFNPVRATGRIEVPGDAREPAPEASR
jgi:hypothetical protein